MSSLLPLSTSDYSPNTTTLPEYNMPSIIGYGTLLSPKSLARTIGEGNVENKNFSPVIVPGYRRIFNLVPSHYTPSHMLDQGNETAAANVQEQDGCFFNAIAFQSTDEEIEKLNQREKYYQLREVTAFRYPDMVEIPNCYVYSADQSSEFVSSAKDLLPNFRDIALARVGSYSYGDAFGCIYDSTTLLADGKSLAYLTYRSLAENMQSAFDSQV